MIAEDIKEQAGAGRRTSAWYVNALETALSNLQVEDSDTIDTGGITLGSENAGEVAEKLQAETFATDPNYADKLQRVLKENEGLINKIKQGKASPDEISKLEMKTGFTSDELASVEDYNEEMFGEGGGDITLIVFNNDAGSSVNGGQSTPPTARRIPPSNEFVPVFDKLAVVELHQIHALGAS